MSTQDPSNPTNVAKPINVGVRLQTSNEADQPTFANFTAVQGDGRHVFLDFGFLEPSIVPNTARLAESGGQLPEQVTGKLASRLVVGIETAAQLSQQLSRHIEAMAARAKNTNDD